jgi:Carboxypeptidase regulatory-like domain/TonB dependent receptor
MRCARFLALIYLTLVVSGLSAYGQFASGVTGTIVDTTGASVPGATITLTDTQLGVSRTAVSNQSGYFRIDSIAASTYNIEIKSNSFKTWVQNGLTLQVDEVRTISPVLQAGDVTATVSVSAALAALDTTSATTGSVIAQVTLDQTPLVGQNVFGLAALAPGVMGSGVTTGDNFSNQYDIHISAAGQRQENNTFMIDGAHVDTDSRGGETPLSPMPELIQSMQISTNQFDAEKGRNSGLNVILFTNSGTNTVHGTVDYYFLNNDLTARTEFQSTVPTYQRNEAGATLGGPIIKNKLFAYGAIDVLRSSTADAYQATVETQQLDSYVQSNFPNNVSTQLFKIAPPQVYPTTGLLTEAQLIAQNPGYYLPPNIPATTPLIGTANINYSIPRNGVQWSGRVDQYVGQNDRIFYETLRTTVSTLSPNTRPALNFSTPSSTLFANTGWTHTFSTHLLNEAGVDFVRALGENSPIPLQSIPSITVTGATGFSGFGPGNYIENNLGGHDVLSWTIKSHELKFGVDLEEASQFGNQSGAYNRPSYTFNNLLDFVQDEAVTESATPINLKTLQAAGALFNSRNLYSGVFVQDNWRATPKLTLNLGLRFDSTGDVLSINQPALTKFTLGAGSTPDEQIANGVQGLAPNHSVLDHDLWALSPRVGFSWDVLGNGNTALRGGFGLYANKIPYLVIYNGLVTNLPIFYTPSLSVYQGNPTPTLSLCDSPQGLNVNCPLLIPSNITFDSHGGIVGQRAVIGGYSPDLKMAQVENWTLSVQQRLRENLTLELNYSASAGHHLPVSTDQNRFSGDLIRNNGVLTRLNQSFGTINYVKTDTNSIGNFGSAVLTRRTSRGLTLRGIYTWGKVLDVYSTSGSTNTGLTPNGGTFTSIIQADNYAAQRGRSDFDIRQQFSFDGVWAVPTPWNDGWKKQAFGGWNLGTVGILQSGPPFTVYTTAAFPVGDYNADGYDFDVPDIPAFGNHLPAQSRKQFLNGLFTASQFPTPPLGQEGNLGRNTYDAPGYANINLNVEKGFFLPWFHGESLKLEGRGEVFNLFNRANLISFDSNMADPLFGHATGQQPARSLQLHVRAQF